MKNFRITQKVFATISLVGLASLCALPSFALTGAGTLINNTATANYTVGGVAATAEGSVSFTVQEIIDVSVSWTDGTNVIVDSPEADQVTTFSIANTGNGTEAFSLAVANIASPTDDFDFTIPADVAIYIEDGTTAGFQIAEDTLYTGANHPSIAAESSQTVYLIAQVPAALDHDNEGHLELTASSTTAGAAASTAGTSLDGLGDSGVDAIVGTSQADSSDVSIYQVSTANVSVTKTIQSTVDEFGTDNFIPNAEVTYLISVTVDGGTADGLVITDPIPANTTYKAGSIVLDTVGLTDISDADSGDFDLTTPGAVTVNLGSVAGGTTHEIEITVVID